MKTFIFIIIFYFVMQICGCAALNVQDFHNKIPIKRKLPITLEIDKHSFKKDFIENLNQFIIENNDIIDIYKKIYPSTYPTSEDFVRDYQLFNLDIERQGDEMIDFIEKELNENYISGESKGRLKCVMQHRTTSLGIFGNFFIFTSAITFGTLNLFGYPYSSQVTELQLDFYIYDNNDNLLKKYSLMGKGTSYCAMYWGYSLKLAANTDRMADITRASYLKALKDAIEKFRILINKDWANIENELM